MTILERLAMNCVGARGGEYMSARMLLMNWLRTHPEEELAEDIGTITHVEALRYLTAMGLSWDLQEAVRRRWGELG